MNIILVENKKQAKEFNALSKRLYKNDPEYIAHLDNDIEAVFSSKNDLLKNGEAKRWLLKDKNNKTIGKIAAFFHKEKNIAGLGFFDCINNQDAANRLFKVGIEFLKLNNIEKIQAPINFGDRDKYWGLMVGGFKRPSYQENYNFPYYQNLFETYGFTKEFVQITSEATYSETVARKLKILNDRLMSQYPYRVESINLNQIDKYSQDFVEIYNQAWTQLSHFEPLDVHRIKKLMKSMKPIIREDLIYFMYDNNRPIAFLISVIDFNQILKQLNGKMNALGKLKFLYYRKTKKIDRIRGIAFGVIPKYQGKGLTSVMINALSEVMQKDPNLKSAELAWIGDFNPRMLRLLENIGAQNTKTHFTYSYFITGSKDVSSTH